ncbi:MAG: ABC transporter permease, partial [Alicyclobacillus macrosporangiidus]|uniref:ABC transporter permease n=1 Tax=Alicyclobacillus macrosporangiidus TaxID=392015 RepID=UPI0026F11050
IVILALYIFDQPDFFTVYGPQSLFNQIITLCIVALGQTIVILTAGIDLSVGAIVGFANSLAATIMVPLTKSLGGDGMGIVVTCLIVLVCGLVMGAVNGLIVVFGRLQPIIVTLATSSIYLGISLYVRPSPGGAVPDGFSTFLTGNVFGAIPVSALVLVLFVLVGWIPVRNSRLGQSLYAVGGNEASAYMSGISVKKAKFMAYALSGVFCACAGLLLTAQTASGDPLGSEGFTLDSIAAVVLGGTSLFGGIGSYYGTIAGASIISLIAGLLIFWNVSSFYQSLVSGIILIVAIGLSAWRGKKSIPA